MRRTRAIALILIGLVAGLSGCAGTHHHHQPAGPPSGLLGGAPGVHGASCACAAPSGSPAPPIGARPQTVVATAPRRSLAVPVPSRSTTGSEVGTPPSSRPVPVPAPGSSGVVRYFPLSEGEVSSLESPWNRGLPDLLGVRTPMVPASPPERPATAGRTPEGMVPPLLPLTSTAAPRSVGRNWLRPRSVQGGPRWGHVSREVIPASAELTLPAPAQSSGLPSPPSRDLAPPMAGPMVETGASAPGRSGMTRDSGKTLGLEYADQMVLEGRPKWDPQARGSGADRDLQAPSTWISALAFSSGDEKPAPTAKERTQPAPSEVKRAAVPRRASAVVSRFFRRVRGAGRAFLDPDSVRGEADDLSQWGQGVERASAHRLDKAPKH